MFQIYQASQMAAQQQVKKWLFMFLVALLFLIIELILSIN